MERVKDPADPNRCQGSSPDGQCMNLAVPGYVMCQAHGGKVARAEANGQRMYNLTKAKYRNRMESLLGHSELKSLQNEITMLRLLLEDRFNVIDNEIDMMVACAPITSMVLAIGKLIKDCHQMEQSLGTLLPKTTVINIGQNIVQILSQELTTVDNHEVIIDRVCERLLSMIDSAGATETLEVE